MSLGDGAAKVTVASPWPDFSRQDTMGMGVAVGTGVGIAVGTAGERVAADPTAPRSKPRPVPPDESLARLATSVAPTITPRATRPPPTTIPTTKERHPIPFDPRSDAGRLPQTRGRHGAAGGGRVAAERTSPPTRAPARRARSCRTSRTTTTPATTEPTTGRL